MMAPGYCKAEECGRELPGSVAFCPFCGAGQVEAKPSDARDAAVAGLETVPVTGQEATVAEPADAAVPEEKLVLASVGDSAAPKMAVSSGHVRQSADETPVQPRRDLPRGPGALWLGLGAAAAVILLAYLGYGSLSGVEAEAQARVAAMEDAKQRAQVAEEAARQARLQAEAEAQQRAQREADAGRVAQQEMEAQRRLQESVDAQRRMEDAQRARPTEPVASNPPLLPGAEPFNPSPAPRMRPPPGPAAAEGPAELQAALEAALRADGVTGVGVQVRDDLTITLKGSLDDPALKERALQTARTAARGHPVKDRIFLVKQ